jgi:acyl transferase domain-containing protein/acyl carrier protein
MDNCLDGGRRGEPIAIIGMACRYPGDIASPEDLWEFVAGERCAAAEMPTDRGWDLSRLFHPDQTQPGRSSSRYGGGFVSDAMMFDPEFFGVSPRDAVAMNPVQRLLLTTTWEVFERAGIVPDAVRGRDDIGTFIGVLSLEYGPLWHEASAEVEGKLITGTLHSASSGRVSHFFGLSGPCITVDTACSASLAGVHLAVQSLRSGECSMALAGGASFQATPCWFTEFTRQGALSSDGRCKSFAESADGTAWSEGVGMLLLARLSDAQRDGRRVLAVIRGSAVNHDGTGTRFAVPNSGAHERMIRRALADAGLAAHEVDAVDAHGTGTRVGDRNEAAAILATYGQRSQSDQPILLGSLKSNLGHTTAAAGVGGVIKMVEAMRHEMLPRTLHVDAPNSRIDWSSGSVRLLTEAASWPRGERPRRAAVSSFGIGGTNAHTILEEAPLSVESPISVDDRDQNRVVPWVLSGRTAQALRDQASALRRHVFACSGLGVADVGYSLATGRTRFECRAAVVGSCIEDFVVGLDAIEAGAFADSVVSAVATPLSGVGFVFPGQGAQFPGMAVGLAAESSVFAAYLNECADALARYCDWSLLDVLHGVPGAPSLDRVDVVQPALFAVMVALARMWMHYGVRPTCVIGHSQGEIAAACVAGALSVPDAAKVVALRSRALRKLSGDYGMASVALPAEWVQPLLTEGMSIAVNNGPRATVIAGPRDALDDLVADLTANGERARMLPVDYASHSAQVESIRAELLTELAGVTARTSGIPFYSTVTGELLDTVLLTAEYWYTNLRQTVRFDSAVRAVLGDGVRHFVEASPHPLLLNAVEEIAADEGVSEVAVVGSLRRDDRGMDGVIRNLGRAFVCGLPVDGAALFDGAGARRVELPTYRFQNRKFWLGNGSATADLASHGLGATGHPLLGAAITLADGGVVLSGTLSTLSHPWLADHGVHGLVVVPGAVLVDMVVQAADEVGCGFVEELVLAAPLILVDEHAVAVQVVIEASDDTVQRNVSIHSRPAAAKNGATSGGWTCHANGVVGPAEHGGQAGVGTWPPAGAAPVYIDGFYDQLLHAGHFYGDTFQGVRAVWRQGTDLFAEVMLPDGVRANARRFTLHPALLDTVLQLLLLDVVASGQARMPFSINRVQIHGSGASELRVRLTAQGDGFSVSAADPAGQPVLSIGAVTTRPISSAQLSVGERSTADSLLRVRWSPVAVPSGVPGLTPDVTVQWCGEADPRRAAAWALASALSFLRNDSAEPARLVLVTRGAMVCDPADDVDAAQAAVWGLVRAARSEHPGRFVLVDVDDRDSSAAMLPAALTLDEPELAIRGDVVSAPRLARVAGEDQTIVPDTPSWHLDIIDKGSMEGLTLIPDEAASIPLTAGQVRVAVRAVGLNFPDSLVTSRILPDDTYLGQEGAGVVVEVGFDVSDLAAGDRVLGIWRHGVGSVAIADRRLVARIPSGWSFAQAASVPITYTTALYGLRDLGSVQPGDRVLVHGAAGGVGAAAGHIAERLGAKVLVSADAGGQSGTVDVVLNVLAGEFPDALSRVLKPGGRFVEVGKTTSVEHIDLDADHRSFDLLSLDGDALGGLLADVVRLLEADVLAELPPLRAWDVRQAHEALRYTRQGQHAGFNVLTLPRALDPDGTVLITGGTGVLGGLLARHLVTEHNVTSLVLTSRRGPDTPGSAELVAELTELGAEVRVVACDIADRAQARTLLAEIGSRLTGVVHTAGALDDGIVESLTAERLDVVFRPKVDGATHLDELTRHLDLGLFVLFSSAAGAIGTQGQANYAAANTAMDAIAIRRHAAGLPAQSLAWGLWQSASGLTSHLNDTDRVRLARAGVLPMPTEQGLALFDAAWADGGAALVTAPLKLNTQDSGASPLLRGLTLPLLRGVTTSRRRLASGDGPTASNAKSPSSKLACMATAERTAALVAIIRSHTAAVLGHTDPEAIGRDRQLFEELGLDSLTAVELRNRLSAETGLRLSPTVVFDHSSPLRLAEHLTKLIAPEHESEPARHASAVLTEATAAAVASEEQISDIDIEDLVAMVNTGSAEQEHEVTNNGSQAVRMTGVHMKTTDRAALERVITSAPVGTACVPLAATATSRDQSTRSTELVRRGEHEAAASLAEPQFVERIGPGGMHIVEYGTGEPIVFIHGGVIGGVDAWQTQLPLAERWRLVLVSRLNYGRSATSYSEDYREDGQLLAELLREFDGGAHLVAQSYGTLGAIEAALRHPGLVRSLTMVESAASAAARGKPVVDDYERTLRELTTVPPGDAEDFFRALFAVIEPTANYPDPLPESLASYARRVLEGMRWPWDADVEVDVAALRTASFGKLVISGGQRQFFEDISDALADQMAGERLVIPGGHATQNTGSAFNIALEKFLNQSKAA